MPVTRETARRDHARKSMKCYNRRAAVWKWAHTSEMKLPKRIVDTDTLARHCNLSPRRIRELTQAGLPKIGRNKFNLIDAISWYIQFLQRALENKGAQTGDGTLELFRSQKARSLTASAALKELEFERRRAEVVTVAESERVLAEFSRLVRARFAEVPIRLSRELLNETSRTMIQAKVESAIREACLLLARTDAATVSEKREN
jgi:phage terminase Nu1 subunit (DNA packaging protein)